ncbi:MAG: hypothetical protein JEZ05_09290 [Tenericutes bacterium]|nr:hypothetical protein [Mycoplasmatota bacterium]
MFFFENYTVVNVLIFLAVLVGLLLVNELTRRSKILSIIVYIVVPVVFTIFVWRSSENTEGNWFAWVKCYSALAGVIGFMALRYIKKLQTNKYFLFFPALILAVNILEAVFRDFEVSQMTAVLQNGLLLDGGPWNIINGIAGILNAVTITGWVGIKVAKTKSQDMVWPDQLWYWVIAYGIWNLSYVYNCIPDRAFYAGVALIFTSTLAAFVGTKGVWLQHRAQTLALWAMFTLTFPNYSNIESGLFTITSTHDAAPKLVLSILAIIANVAVLVYEIYKIRKTKRNPLKEELYSDLSAYKNILKANNL